MTRTCDRCGVEKELNEDNFRRHKPSLRWFRRACRQCGYLRHGTYQKTPEKLPVIMFQSAKHRAKRDGVPITIKAVDIVIPEFCPVFGVRLQVGTRQNHENAPSLDRIKPEAGYVAGNIRVISHLANMLKSKATAAQLRQLADYIEGHVLSS